MKHALSAILASTVLLAASARAQLYIYTNAPAGSTVSLTNNVEVSVPMTNLAEAVGIAFGAGATNGTLSGTGDFTVTNMADAVSFGATNLIGIQAATLTNNYSGAVTVNQDLSAYTNALDGEAYGYDADIHGELNGAVTVDVTGTTYNNMASPTNMDNHATAIGINGNISGNLNAEVTVSATGATSIGSAASEQNASAFAFGVVGDIGGDVSAAVSASAEAQEASGNQAVASSQAWGIDGDISGGVHADITANAMGGTSTGATSSATSAASAYGINGSVSNDVTGAVTATAQGGNALAGGTQSASANADAIGIRGEVGGEISGQIHVTATGGTAVNTATGGESADATATGIDSFGVPVSQMTIAGGGITASAIAGTVGGVTNGAEATSTGILADTLSLKLSSGTVSANATGSNADATAIFANSLSLDMSSGTISADAAGSDADATAISADSLSITNSGTITASATGTNATATAIQAATVNLYMDAGSLTALENGVAATAISTGSGSVYLGNVDVVGSVVGTLDVLSVYGDSSINGDISATDTSIENGGSLTFINEQAMLTGSLTVKSNATLGVILTPSDTSSTALDVSGGVTVEETGILRVTVPKGTASDTVLGNSYRAVGASAVTGLFEGSYALYTFSVTNLADGVWVTIDGVAQQTGASTPAVANSMVSLSRTTLAMMSDVSTRLGGVRAILRDPASIAAPIGAAGPDEVGSGDWTAYLHQINTFGEQDGTGGVDGYNFNSHGLLLGAEKLLGDQLLIGANAGYINTGFDGDVSQQDGSSGVYPANVYGDLIKEDWHWGAGLTVAASTSDTTRQDSGGEYYSGDFDSTYLGGWMDGSYMFGSKSVTYEPYARAAYLKSQHDGYSDSGGGAPLSVGDNTVDNLISEIGVKVSKTWHRKKKKDEFELSVKAGWLQEWMDSQVIIDNATLGGIPQVFKSAEPSDSALVLAITENWYSSDQLTLGLTYQPVISENWYYHSFSVNLDYTF